jgi:hypothetical protein
MKALLERPRAWKKSATSARRAVNTATARGDRGPRGDRGADRRAAAVSVPSERPEGAADAPAAEGAGSGPAATAAPAADRNGPAPVTRRSGTPAMRAIEIRAGGPEVLVEAVRPDPVPGAGELLMRRRSLGREPPGCAAAQGCLYPMPPGASDLPGLESRRHGGAGDAEAMAAAGLRGRPRLRPGGRWRLRRALRRAGRAVPAGAGGLSMLEAASLPETFFTVWSNVFDRGAAGRRDLAGAGRLQRHRRHRDPARQGDGRDGDRHRRQRRQVRGLPGAGRRPRHQLPHARTSCRGEAADGGPRR